MSRSCGCSQLWHSAPPGMAVGCCELRLRSTPRYRLVCICFPTPGRGLPYGSGLGLSRCLGPGECLHSFIHVCMSWCRLAPAATGTAAAKRPSAERAACELGPGCAGTPGLQPEQRKPGAGQLHSEHLLLQPGPVCVVGQRAALCECITGVCVCVRGVHVGCAPVLDAYIVPSSGEAQVGA